jgi:structural maintenance of chromosome 2
MHITEVIMEGFKSYATRTVINGWDPEFNAITGLNGSGKSNVLDGICFVLGISNLSQVSQFVNQSTNQLTNQSPPSL